MIMTAVYLKTFSVLSKLKTTEMKSLMKNKSSRRWQIQMTKKIFSHAEESINDEISQLGQSAGESGMGRSGRAQKYSLMLTYEHLLTDDEDADVADMLVTNDPSNYDEALKSSQRARWHKAMEEEVLSLCEHHTWNVVPTSESNQAFIDCRCVFK